MNTGPHFRFSRFLIFRIQNQPAGTCGISGNTLTVTFNDGRRRERLISTRNMDGQKNLVISGSYYPQEK